MPDDAMSTVPSPSDGPGVSPGAVGLPLELRGLEQAVEPLSGVFYCHAPADRRFEVRRLARPDDGHDRWGSPACRTVFLASDPGLAIAEYARHREPSAPADERRIVAVTLTAVSVLDLRRGEPRERVERSGGRGLLERATARAIAARIRQAELCQGLIVPSMAFLDRP